MSTTSALLLAGCFEPETGADELEQGAEPPGQLFGGDAGTGSGDCGSTTPTPLAKLDISVLTSAFGGRYKPRNVGAIWIETSSGQFVKTIERWGKTRAKYLTKFNASSAGNIVDAVTSATLSSHVTHTRSWNLTDVKGCKIAPGSYRLQVEHTDYNGTGALLTLPFTTDPGMQTPADSTYFHSVSLKLN